MRRPPRCIPITPAIAVRARSSSGRRTISGMNARSWTKGWHVRLLGSTVICLLVAASPSAAAGDKGFDPPLWMTAPFGLLLLSIALLPLFVEKFWHLNRNKAIVAILFSIPVIVYLLTLPPAP